MLKAATRIFLLALLLAPSVQAERKADSYLLKCCNNLETIVTANKRYSVDFDGQHPASLRKLAPKYLNRIPRCPTTKIGYAYRRDKELGYVVQCQGNHKAAGVGNSKPRYDTVNALSPKVVLDRYKVLRKKSGASRHGRACKSNLRNIATALEMWSTDHKGRYPRNFKALTPNYLYTLPVCPAARHDTYTATYKRGTKADSYSFYCKGHYHKSEQFPANRPAYDSKNGLK